MLSNIKFWLLLLWLVFNFPASCIILSLCNGLGLNSVYIEKNNLGNRKLHHDEEADDL